MRRDLWRSVAGAGWWVTCVHHDTVSVVSPLSPRTDVVAQFHLLFSTQKRLLNKIRLIGKYFTNFDLITFRFTEKPTHKNILLKL